MSRACALALALLLLPSCTPAQQAVTQQIEAIIVQDLTAGKSLAQVEADVARLLAGQPGADIVAIVDAALVLLVDAGVLPPSILPLATRYEAEERSKLAARKP